MVVWLFVFVLYCVVVSQSVAAPGWQVVVIVVLSLLVSFGERKRISFLHGKPVIDCLH